MNLGHAFASLVGGPIAVSLVEPAMGLQQRLGQGVASTERVDQISEAHLCLPEQTVVEVPVQFEQQEARNREEEMNGRDKHIGVEESIVSKCFNGEEENTRAGDYDDDGKEGSQDANEGNHVGTSGLMSRL